MSSRHYVLKATKRERAGKGVARALRRENKTPAVIYGDHKEPLTIALDENALNLEYRKGHMFTSLCDMEVDGEKHLLLVRDVQTHPVTDNVIHADFLRVTPRTKIAVMVPVHFINEEECPGIREKGSLAIQRFEVELECTATEIPDHIDFDLAGKNIGDAIKLSDAKLPAGAKSTSTRDLTIATINAPKTAEQEAAEEAAMAAAAPAAEVPADKVAAPADAAAADAAAKAGDAKAPAKK
ncbi:MAG: 50S ribosomal protein L25/general stress protein Ctc [Alphaproteobacteria bacterium]|nr:50S ribosomal protein L25/general stress protein Ctc [Alphaproteobacteria bacterium]